MSAFAGGYASRHLRAGGDAMRGREAGTLDEMRATGWMAERAREAGLEPAGEDGTFFQWWPMRRTRLRPTSQITVGGRPLTLWNDVVVTAPIATAVDLPLVFVGEGRSDRDAMCAGRRLSL